MLNAEDWWQSVNALKEIIMLTVFVMILKRYGSKKKSTITFDQDELLLLLIIKNVFYYV